MTELRTSLKKIIENNQVMQSILPFAFVLVLIDPVFAFIGSLHYIGLYSSIRSILYIAYLIGLILCFAVECNWAIGAAFCIIALRMFVSMIRMFSFNALIDTVFYAFLAVFFLRLTVIKQEMGGTGFAEMPFSHTRPPEKIADAASQFCAGCGKPVDISGKFCPSCGTPYSSRQLHRPSASELFHIPSAHIATEQHSGPTGMLYSMCGSILALAFTILLSANTMIALIANFSVITVIAQIPMILICIGCWMIYTGSAQNRLNHSGFTLISGVLIAELVICYIPIVFVEIAMIFLMFRSSSFVGFGIGVLIVCFILTFVCSLYWNGLRTTAVSARNILQGKDSNWRTSMFAIVMICIHLAGQVIGLAISSSLNSRLDEVLNTLSHRLYYTTGSSAVANTLADYFTSLLGGNRGLATLSSLLSIAVLACAMVILIQIRNKNKNAGY